MTGDQYLRAVRDRWRIVALAVVVGVLAAVVAIFVVPKRYAATVDTFVLPAGVTADAASAYEGGLLSAQRVKSYVQLFTGGRVSDVVVDRLGLPMTSSELTGEMAVASQTDSVILTITVEDSSPERALQIANASAKAFQDLVAGLETPADSRTPPATSVKIVAPAKVGDGPSFPHRSLFVTAGAALGLLAGIGLALWRNARGRPVRSPDDLRGVLGVPGLGVVLRSAPPTPAALLPDEFSPEIEALRQIRTSLQFADVDHPRKLVLITSAVAAEGKTTTACSLAAVLGAAGHRVLLVDADLRRPGAGALTGLDTSVGITTVLTGHVTAEEATQRHPAGFDFLATGKLPHNPSELTSSDAMGTLLSRVRERYEYVLVDSAPLLPVTDAATLAGRADGVVLVCRFGSTLDVEVRDAAHMLETVDATLWGSVLTMVPKRGTGGRRYGYYDGRPSRGDDVVPPTPRPSTRGAVHPAADPLDSPTLIHAPFVANGRPHPRPRPSHALPPS